MYKVCAWCHCELNPDNSASRKLTEKEYQETTIDGKTSHGLYLECWKLIKEKELVKGVK